MSQTAAPETLTGEALVQALERVLFPENHDGEPLNTYAVLDGAAIPDLLDHLYGDEPPEFECLYMGELEPDLAECAPYLVQIKSGAAFTKWLLSEGWGKSWGIFAHSSADIRTMRRHFRKFLMVKGPEGKQVYFRYYDPRVFNVYLPTCNQEECGILFGPIRNFTLEIEDQAGALLFWSDESSPRMETVALT